MSETLEAVRRLIAAGDVRISEHGYDELSDDDIPIRDLLSGIQEAPLPIKDYPAFQKAPRCWCYNSTALVAPFISYLWVRKDSHYRQFL